MSVGQPEASRSQDGRPGPLRRVLVVVDLLTVLYVAFGVLAAAAIFAVFRAAPATITKIAVGMLLALALDPLVGATRRRLNCSRAVAVGVVGGVLTIAFTGVIIGLGPPAIRQARRFTTELPTTVKQLYSWPIIGHKLSSSDAAGKVDQWIKDLPAHIDDKTVGNVAAAIVGGFATAVVVLVTALAVMLDGDGLVARARRLVPPHRRERADWAGRVFYRTVGNYFAGSLFVATLNGLVILTAGLALGVPLAPIAAIWATLTNLIPQVGGFLGGGFFVLLALTKGPVQGVIALALFLAYQQIENHIISPAIVGNAVNLTPPTTMLAALIGGAAAGVPGALAATPLVGTVKSLFLEFRTGAPVASERRRRRFRLPFRQRTGKSD